MELWTEIRRRVLTKELSQRAACKEYEVGWWTLQKILAHAEPPGYRLTKPRPGAGTWAALGCEAIGVSQPNVIVAGHCVSQRS